MYKLSNNATLITLLLLCTINKISCFSSKTKLSMVPNLFNIGNKKEVELPRDVKEAVSKCRASVQTGLQQRISRMTVQMPVGAKFGVEKIKKKRNDGEEGVSKDTLDTSDRELARIFVE